MRREPVTSEIQAKQPIAPKQRELQRQVALTVAQLCVWSWNRETQEFSLLEGTESVLGFDLSQQPGKTLLDFIHPEDRDCVIQANDRAVQEETSFEQDFRLVRPDGTSRWIRQRGGVLRDEVGQITGTVGVSADITAQKKIEEDLLESQQLLQLVMDYIPQCIFWKDSDSVYLGCNRSFAEIAGVETPENIVGKTDYDLAWTHEEADCYRENDRTVMASNTPLYRVIEPQTDVSGRNYWSEVNKLPLHNQAGDVVGILGTFQDVTERFIAEEALRQSESQLRERTQDLEQLLQTLQTTQAQLVQSEKMSSLGQLVAGVAHEINNPINFIHGNLIHAAGYIQDLLQLVTLYQVEFPQATANISELIEEIDLEFLREDLIKLLFSMKVGTERVSEIVRSLRIFSRLDEAETKAINLHDGIDSTLMILQNRLEANPNRPTIRVVKQYGDLPEVECYAGQLNQVFMNILTNAIDALEESWFNGQETFATERSFVPTITIRTTVISSQWIGIAIADNGPGIPEETQQRIFDPFFTTKPVGKGTGLGMSISYQIVTEKHGGRIRCNSSPGQGTEFWIEIPVSTLQPDPLPVI